MESRKNYDIFNIVSDTIIKWYEQTKTDITEIKLVCPNLDSELLGILLAAKSQTSGALTTLANEHILSTHVLLRVLCETYAVLRWALNVSTQDHKIKYEEVYKRLRSWDCYRLQKDKAFFEEVPQTSEIKSYIGQIKGEITKLEEDGIKVLPNVQQLYSNLGRGWDKVYTIFFRKYSRAVHINRNITQQLSWVEENDAKQKAILYKNDIDPDSGELLNIASISCDINMAIRSFYGLNFDAIQNEYEQIKSELAKT